MVNMKKEDCKRKKVIYRFNNMARLVNLIVWGRPEMVLRQRLPRWSLFDNYDILVEHTVTTLIGAIPILAIKERQITLAEPERSQNE